MTDDTKSDKDMHKSDWMVPPRPHVPKAIEEARQIAKDTYRKVRASKRNPVAKNMNSVNKPATHRDRKNDYRRKANTPGKRVKNERQIVKNIAWDYCS